MYTSGKIFELFLHFGDYEHIVCLRVLSGHKFSVHFLCIINVFTLVSKKTLLFLALYDLGAVFQLLLLEGFPPALGGDLEGTLWRSPEFALCSSPFPGTLFHELWPLVFPQTAVFST